MSGCKTIITFNSGRTVEITGDWVDDLAKMNGITQFQTFPSDDGKRWGTVINMNQVETVKVVNE